MMRKRGMVAAALLVSLSPAMANEEIKLPPEVTPALRAACEQDVRRLCIGENPSFEKVRRCVEQKFSQLNARCRVAIASAGLMR